MENCKPTDKDATPGDNVSAAPVVIVTRPEPDGSAFAEAARGRGLATILSPVMEIVFSADPAQRSTIETGGALAFTSANGVRAYAAQFADRETPVFAVGEATAKTAEAAGFKSVRAAGGDVDALAAMIIDARPDGPVVHIAGTARAGDLVAALKAAGLEARRDVIYAAVERESLSPEAAAAISAATRPVAVALFSPRSADIFLRQLQKAAPDTDFPHLRFACLSKAVAERIKNAAISAKFKPDAISVATVMTGEALIALLSYRHN